jgi:hypothetical protein
MVLLFEDRKTDRMRYLGLAGSTAIAACLAGCAQPTYDTAFVSVQTGTHGASPNSEIIGTIIIARIHTVFCLKPSASNPPDINCPTNGMSDPSGNNFRWGQGTVVPGRTLLAYPEVAPLLTDPTENLTITFLPGSDAPAQWDIQSVTLQLQDSMGVLPSQTVVRVGAPLIGVTNCVARMRSSSNSTTVSFAWANMSSDDALNQSPGGVFVDGNQAGQSSACPP